MRKRNVTCFMTCMLILAVMLTSCTTIKNNLPSAPSSEGVRGKNQLPSFNISRRVKEYSSVEPLITFCESLLAEGYEFTEEEMTAIDGRAAELLTGHFSDDLFPYNGADVPFKELVGMFGENALPRTEAAINAFSERYEKTRRMFSKIEGAEDIDSLLTFTKSLIDDSYEWRELDLETIDLKAEKLLRAEFDKELFPYAEKEVPYEVLCGLFGEGKLPKTETAVKDFRGLYEALLLQDIRDVRSLNAVEEILEKYRFLASDMLEDVYSAVYLKLAGIEPSELIADALSDDLFELDMIRKFYWVAEDAPGREDIVTELEAAGYTAGKEKTLTKLTDDIIDLFRGGRK